MTRRQVVALSCKASELESQLAASLRLHEEGARFVDPATLPTELELRSRHAELARIIREGRPRR